MAGRETERLTARAVQTLTTVGRHADGGNLFLSISKNGGRRWVFLYRERGRGRLREMGLGPAPGPKKSAGVSLKDARQKAAEARTLLYSGADPLTHKRANKAAGSTVTFGEIADEVVTALESGFRNEKHRAQWKSTLADYAASLRPMLVREITTEDILGVLRPIWEEKNETASRLRGRIERVLDAARAKGFRTGDNPARWRGHLDKLLSKRKKLTRGHHEAIPFKAMPAFMTELRTKTSTSALALEFTILNAVRTNETCGARWKEIDLEERLWTIPGDRMKAHREHRVPLSDRAVEILKSMLPPGKVNPDAYVFPGAKDKAPLSNMAMLQMVRGMRGAGVTVHGFRSAFKDWAAEATSHENIVSEMALAHTVGNKVEEAYRRGDLFEKRKALMKDWSVFLGTA